jgi:hypothetical protein
MVSRESSLGEMKELVKACLRQLYNEDAAILTRNKGAGVCERSIVFRFAHYLQNRISGYFVDCDFNSHFEFDADSQGHIISREERGKPIRNVNGSVTPRFVDIIVHKRDRDPQSDLICFEIKKWNNTNQEKIEKDRNNLHVLTSEYGYVYGFHMSIHKEKTKTKWTIFADGAPIEQDVAVFESTT